MNIGRHNYEEFFLLFADNELNAAERKAVEAFVAQNPDLKAELQLLLQTIIPADEVLFTNKDVLLKEEMTPLQAQLLLYMDDELPAAEKQDVAALINTDTAAANEAAILLQTKLQPDASIVYANKKELYRKEEGRLVRMNWRMAAAAAVLLGLMVWGGLTLMQSPKHTDGANGLANTTQPVQQKEKAGNVIASTATAQTPAETGNTNPVTTKENTVKENTAANSSTAATVQKNNAPAVNNTNTVKQQGTAVTNSNDNTADVNNSKKPSNNLPAPTNNPHYNNFNNDNRNITLAQNVPPAEDAVKKANSGNPDLAVSSSKPNTSAVNGYAITAAYKADETEEKSDNKVLYMDEDNVKRSKLAGFIRKVKRVVERNTNIKTANGIQVAGFDIALNK